MIKARRRRRDGGGPPALYPERILPSYGERRAELEAAPRVHLQALGESLDPTSLSASERYEVHLDRKFERTLSTLLRLQELRPDRAGPA